jgi:hypothetical protein
MPREHRAIDADMVDEPQDHKLMTEKCEIEDQIPCCIIKLKDEVKMKLTDDVKMAHSKAQCSHCNITDGLKKSHGKIYSLLLGQCTHVLIGKMKQDAGWGMVSDSFNPITLFELIEKFVLKQSDNQYKIAVLIAEFLPNFFFHQDDQVSYATYYACFTLGWRWLGRQECATICQTCWLPRQWSCYLQTLIHSQSWNRAESSCWPSRITLPISSCTMVM